MNVELSEPIVRTSHPGQLNETVVIAVADATNVDPFDLTPSLYDVIDPDALEKLFEPLRTGRPRSGGRVHFSMAGCDVTVESDGRVVVSSPAG